MAVREPMEVLLRQYDDFGIIQGQRRRGTGFSIDQRHLPEGLAWANGSERLLASSRVLFDDLHSALNEKTQIVSPVPLSEYLKVPVCTQLS